MTSTTGRYQLAPGLRVVRRGRDRLQVGLYDERRVLLPRTAEVEHLLGRLLDRQPVAPDASAAVAHVLDELEQRGCLLAAELLCDRAQRREVARVAVLGTLPGADPADLLARCGLRSASSPSDADVVLLLSGGELDREVLDPLVRRGTTHLVVRLVDGGALLGPFTVPGRTACLRCIDAQRSIADHDHVAVTTRYLRATARPRADGMPDVVDPALATVAVAWAVRDVAAWVEGREPATWSRTVHLGAEPAHREEQTWLRHPQCGCSWSAEGLPSGTMEQ